MSDLDVRTPSARVRCHGALEAAADPIGRWHRTRPGDVMISGQGGAIVIRAEDRAVISAAIAPPPATTAAVRELVNRFGDDDTPVMPLARGFPAHAPGCESRYDGACDCERP